MDDARELGKWLSVREASEVSGYATEYIRQLIRNKDVYAIKKGFAWFVSKQSLLEYKDKKTHVN